VFRLSSTTLFLHEAVECKRFETWLRTFETLVSETLVMWQGNWKVIYLRRLCIQPNFNTRINLWRGGNASNFLDLETRWSRTVWFTVCPISCLRYCTFDTSSTIAAWHQTKTGNTATVQEYGTRVSKYLVPVTHLVQLNAEVQAGIGLTCR
jgi:hypothetical protein